MKEYKITLYELSENKHNGTKLTAFNAEGVKLSKSYRQQPGMIGKIKSVVESKATWRSCDMYIDRSIADLNAEGDIIINVTFKNNIVPDGCKFDAFVISTVEIGNAKTSILPQYVHIMSESIRFGGRQFLTGVQLKIPAYAHTQSLEVLARELHASNTTNE